VLKNGKSLNPSQNSYDWLGHGIYFWEADENRALEWAKKNQKFKNPTVIGAFIQLGNCLNLLNAEHIKLVKSSYEILKDELKILGLPLPKNKKAHKHDKFNLIRELDCRVIMRLHQYVKELITADIAFDENELAANKKRAIQHHPQFIDSVRGMFPEEKELYPTAGFQKQNCESLAIC